MKPSLSIKTLFRSPVRTLLTFILLGVVTFAFFSQTAEYSVTAREFAAAAAEYAGVGTVEVAPPEDSDPSFPYKLTLNDTATHLYEPLSREQIGDISALPYITSTDTRFMTPGISDTYFRLDDGQHFFNFSARCVIEGTLTGVNYRQPPESVNYLTLSDSKLLAGNPPWAVDQQTLTITSYPKTYAEGDMGGSGRLFRCIVIYTSDYIFDTEHIQNLTTGNRYAFVLRFDPLLKQEYFLSDHLSAAWCDAVWPLEGVPDNYLETDAFAPLRQLIEITNADIHTFDMVYTKDMSSILRFVDGSMTITDGRALTPEDSAGGARVCVVSREFAEANTLTVGDSITMKLGTKLFEQYRNLGAVAGTPERYALPEKTTTFEIVGIYTDTDGPSKQARQAHWSYSVNTIFVPTSQLPVREDALAGHMFAPSEFSFKIEDARDIPAFLEQAEPTLKQMGLSLIFDDDGWLDIANGFQAARQVSLIKIAVLSATVAAATGFVVYLFIGRKKKEYAVMRALGTTKKAAARSLLLPLSAISVVAVLAGSAAGWIYTVKTITQSNALSVLKEYAISSSVPASAAVGSILGEILLTLLIAILMLRRIGALSPLALLHNSWRSKARGKITTSREKRADAGPDASVPSATSTPLASYPPQADAPIGDATASSASRPVARPVRKSGLVMFVLRYIGRHIYRSAGKAALAIVLAALFFAAVGQFALIKQSYTQLCTDTVVKANFVGGLKLGAVPKILKQDFVTEPYYEVVQVVEINFIRTELAVTNSIARFTGEEVDITYADGYDASVFDQLDNVIIVGTTFAELYMLKLGDMVQLSPEMLLKKLQSSRITEHRTTYPEDTRTDEEILTLYEDEIASSFGVYAHTFTIAGVVSTPSGAYDDMAFTPGTYEVSELYGAQAELDMAEFTLADNFRADEFRAYAQQVIDAGSAGTVTFVMDTSELEHLQNSLRLLETLYPIAVAAALVIGGFLCCLVILQSSKEAAIMRILGTTKRKTRVILALEQIILGIVGLAVGAGALIVYKGAPLSGIQNQLLLFASLYVVVIVASAAVCSSLATRRNVLELLQTKE